MKKTLIPTAVLIAGAAWTTAATVALTPADINGLDTTTSSFTDGNITLTPFIGSTQATFNGDAIRLGIDDVGTNVNAFNDPDTNPNNGNEENLDLEFAPTVGLSSITYDFSRADGPGANDGVIISGFISDPTVSFSLSNVNLFAVYDSGLGTVRLNIPGGLFNGNDIVVSFDPEASNGQTLNLRATDTTQAGAQLAITGISYETELIPEPSSLALFALGGLALLGRRRK